MIETGHCSCCAGKAERSGDSWRHVHQPGCYLSVSRPDLVWFMPEGTDDQAVLDEHLASRTPGCFLLGFAVGIAVVVGILVLAWALVDMFNQL